MWIFKSKNLFWKNVHFYSSWQIRIVIFFAIRRLWIIVYTCIFGRSLGHHMSIGNMRIQILFQTSSCPHSANGYNLCFLSWFIEPTWPHNSANDNVICLSTEIKTTKNDGYFLGFICIHKMFYEIIFFLFGSVSLNTSMLILDWGEERCD